MSTLVLYRIHSPIHSKVQLQKNLSYFVRKAAHFTEFTALGMLLAWLHGMLQKGKLQPFLWGILAASVDETIQCFVPDRGPSLFDVGIDTFGVLTGMLLLIIGHSILFQNPMEEQKQ